MDDLAGLRVLVVAGAHEGIVAQVAADVGRDDLAVDAVARDEVFVLAGRGRGRGLALVAGWPRHGWAGGQRGGPEWRDAMACDAVRRGGEVGGEVGGDVGGKTSSDAGEAGGREKRGRRQGAERCAWCVSAGRR